MTVLDLPPSGISQLLACKAFVTLRSLHFSLLEYASDELDAMSEAIHSLVESQTNLRVLEIQFDWSSDLITIDATRLPCLLSSLQLTHADISEVNSSALCRTSLRFLSLRQFQGEDPSKWLSNLCNLQKFHLSGNRMAGWQLPPAISKLPALKV